MNIRAWACLMSLCALPAHAAEWSLEWSAPVGCIDADTLVRRVEAKVGRKVFVSKSTHQVSGSIEAIEGGFRLKLTAADTVTKSTTTQHRLILAADCHGLDARLVFDVASIIEPELLR